MPYKDPLRQKEYNRLKGIQRREYFRDRWRRIHGKKDINPKFYRQGELYALRILKGSIDRNKNETAEFDIYWNGKKIDVKTAHYRFSKSRIGKKDGKIIGSSSWKFKLTQRGKVDYFFLVCFEGKEIKYIFLIPDEELGNIKWLSLVKSSIAKWNKFLIK